VPVYLHQFGLFQDSARLAQADSHNRLTVDATQLNRHWHRCGMSSDFWARYHSLASPRGSQSPYLSRDSAFHVYTYLLNELFENCAKFTSGPLTVVSVDTWMFADQVVYQVSNYLRPAGVQGFAQLVQNLLQGDLEEMYFQRLEANAESGGGGSGLGYLTLMKDYGIKFGFGFETIDQESVRLDVQALVSKKES